MTKLIKLLLKIVGGVVALVVFLLATAAILLNTQSVQDDLAAYAGIARLYVPNTQVRGVD